jgi:hypothetical protein
MKGMRRKTQPIALAITAFAAGILLSWFIPPIITVILEAIVLLLCGILLLKNKNCSF